MKSLHDLGARDDRSELVLEAVDRELEEKKMKNEETIETEETETTEATQETVKEGV